MLLGLSTFKMHDLPEALADSKRERDFFGGMGSRGRESERENIRIFILDKTFLGKKGRRRASLVHKSADGRSHTCL